MGQKGVLVSHVGVGIDLKEGGTFPGTDPLYRTTLSLL